MFIRARNVTSHCICVEMKIFLVDFTDIRIYMYPRFQVLVWKSNHNGLSVYFPSFYLISFLYVNFVTINLRYMLYIYLFLSLRARANSLNNQKFGSICCLRASMSVQQLGIIQVTYGMKHGGTLSIRKQNANSIERPCEASYKSSNFNKS